MELKEGISWNSNTTQYNKTDDITYSTGTFNSVKHIKQLKDNCSEKVKTNRGEPKIEIFIGEDGEQEGMDFYKNNLKSILKGRGPNKTKKNDEGFFIRPLGKDSKRKEVLSIKRLHDHRKWNLDGDASKKRTQYTWFPCYTDVNDPNTLQWWLIWYE